MLDFTKFTADSLAVKSLRDLISLITFQSENWDKIITHMPGALNGKKIGYIGKLAPVGTPGAGCGPTYVNGSIPGDEKAWVLGEWEVPLKLCYKDLIGTIAQYTLKKGTAVDDLTGGEYYTEIIMPSLEVALNEMIWRLSWFGDVAAKNIADAGVITAGVDVELMKTIDGFWKRLFKIGTDNPTQRTTIAANAQLTTALQKSTLLADGVARGIFDDMIMNAHPSIAGQPGAGIFATKSLCDALYNDMQQAKFAMQPWETLFAGFKVSNYNGTPIYMVAEWDNMIIQFENGSTVLNLPHRAVFTFPQNLLLGTDGNQPVTEIDSTFNKIDRYNYIYAKGEMGTVILHDNMVQVAY